MGYESLTEFSINQSIIIYFTVHKCMPKNFQDYLGNKVTFLKWEDNGLLLANFIEFFCRVLIRHYYNKFRKLIAKYSNEYINIQYEQKPFHIVKVWFLRINFQQNIV